MKKIYYVSVKLLSSMHINGGTSADGMRVTLKNGNTPYIPASLFKGIVRENFEKIASSFDENSVCRKKHIGDASCNCISCRMFGKAGFQKSRIIFDNLETEQECVYDVRTNVMIDRYLGKATKGALVFTETVGAKDAYGKNIEFKGQITAYYPDDICREAQAFFVTAVEFIKYIGLSKSRGLGFVEVTINEE